MTGRQDRVLVVDDDPQDLVVVVDDDRAVRESLKFALEIEGLHVRVCASGQELLSDPALHQARCLILDYKMPGLDGIMVLQRLAAAGVRIPAILITSHATAGLRRLAEAAGVRHILEKPLLGEVLLEHIHQVMGPQAAP